MTNTVPVVRVRSSTVVHRPWVVAIALVLLMLLAVSCQGEEPQESTVEAASAEEGVAQETTVVEPLAPEEAAAPVQVQIPAIGLDVPVTPMEWHVVTIDGERTTAWDVPLDSLGWHVNSAGAGSTGNVLLSGRQADGEALLESLALGTVEADQEVILTDENGLEFMYQVREVSEPIPVSGATDEEKARSLAYVTSKDDATLTLISGWPEFTTTHRVFAVADLVGTPE